MNKKWARDVGAGAVALGAAGAIAFGAFTVFGGANAAEPTPEPTVAAITVDLASVPYTNGLAAEQETEAAAAVKAEQDRLAAKAAAAEAARIAAEQAAAAEAERIAAEQAVAEEEPVVEEPEPEYTGPVPGTQVHTICQVLEDGTQVPCQH
ncbi:hypothetical protein ABIQ69_11585 [Agromyces sp. G08B096]|uniref:Uncharacterized protein n=1 Tax=Agromyces sp. G08B096 TaxID=3156399 RepID=A0AAU7W664_9MICO